MAPQEVNGRLVMSVEDLAQSLDVRLRRTSDGSRFTHGTHVVILPDQGSTATVDGRSLALGGLVERLDGRRAIPVDNLARALGVAPIRLSQSEIVFKPRQG